MLKNIIERIEVLCRYSFNNPDVNVLLFAGSQIFHSHIRRYSSNYDGNKNISMLNNEKSHINCLVSDSFLSGNNSIYIDEIYSLWVNNPASVHNSWNEFFRNFENGNNYTPKISISNDSFDMMMDTKEIHDHLRVQGLIKAYQSSGHFIAKLDPLKLQQPNQPSLPELELSYYGFSSTDLNRLFYLPTNTAIGGEKSNLSLLDIINRLNDVYCDSIGVQYMHIDNEVKRNWIRQKFETPNISELNDEDKADLLKDLIASTQFEDFLAKKWASEKRFGIEGAESMIPAINKIIRASVGLGVKSFIIGMPHRGRLNVLANVCKKPLEQIISQFSHNLSPEDEGSGDVKYHLGTSQQLKYNDSIYNVAVVANPSHLESVGPIVQGKTAAEQFYNGDRDGKKVMSIILHGDAAFSGQGVVYETLNLSSLKNYTTNGTIHIVIDNQIGFTTDPRHARSTLYSTDVAKVVDAPIFHVNADNPEAVIHVCKVASEWRSTFSRDVVIDLVSYRRNGHNEMDNPMFTQPVMYQRISNHIPVLKSYTSQLSARCSKIKCYVDNEKKIYMESCESAFLKNDVKMLNKDWLDSVWKGFFNKNDVSEYEMLSTGVDHNKLYHICRKFSTPPDNGFRLHPGLSRILESHLRMTENGRVDWALGEAMAIGSILLEKKHVRLSGQDVERGTFSHRHHVLHDQKEDLVTFTPLNHLSNKQGHYTVCNSSLSEFAVLGFELGYSLPNPHSLVMWEAQFGDFNNNAQCIIDQFISSGQDKWVRQTGLVMLLPHGYEGMGPEHSSARPERFLQMSNDDADIIPDYSEIEFESKQLLHTNWIIANCTTPANYFHLLRRQLVLPFRKPLIIFTPKSLLRHPLALSSINEMLPGTFFQRIIPSKSVPPSENVERIILCTGKIYYELAKERDFRNLTYSVPIIRIEQLSPFPYDLLLKEFENYPNAELVWVQEEPKNMGYWTYFQPRLISATKGLRKLSYVGRSPSAATATGNKHVNVEEQDSLVKQSFIIS